MIQRFAPIFVGVALVVSAAPTARAAPQTIPNGPSMQDNHNPHEDE